MARPSAKQLEKAVGDAGKAGEIVLQLEDLARNGTDAARLGALKQLSKLRGLGEDKGELRGLSPGELEDLVATVLLPAVLLRVRGDE